MKKFLAVLFSFVLFVFCLSASSCQIGGDSASDLLTYNKKYILKSDVSEPAEEQTYFIFYTNGTCKSHSYYSSYNSTYNYTITCKYEIIEEEATLFCFYHSVEYHANDNQKSVKSNFSMMLMVTDFVVMTTGGDMYICEEYLKEIPNFGK